MFGDENVEHMVLSDASRSAGSKAEVEVSRDTIERTAIPAFLIPYWSPQHFRKAVTAALQGEWKIAPDDRVAQALVDGEVFGVELSSALASQTAVPQALGAAGGVSPKAPALPRLYSGDLFSEVERFTAHVVARFSSAEFDIIHAHDWMTFPAGVALAQLTHRPLVVHVHSLELDRSGANAHATIDAIEGFGVRSAQRVIAVSHYTKRAIERRHHVSPERIAVVHNGIYPREVVNDYRRKKTWPKHVVLFLGRVTSQKGPEYFVEVATRVIPHIKDILFVLAGAGDMLPTLIEQVRRLSLQEYFLFPGFVQGDELEELFSVADLYVMPSVSEPFGIAALEAISFETPVLLSKQSGAAEVLQNVLKTDFWDTNRMADLIINTLLYPELRDELITNAKDELSRLHWDIAAAKTVEIYRDLQARC
jgi:glycosyltransferase involved in cell wall biosynthesis